MSLDIGSAVSRAIQTYPEHIAQQAPDSRTSPAPVWASAGKPAARQAVHDPGTFATCANP